MDNSLFLSHGPLAQLAGIWEGDKGDDTAPADDRGTEKNLFRERLIFEPIGPTMNHEQCLFGLRYSTTAWRISEKEPFHEELGYWLWDAKNQQVMRCFLIPRGVTTIAGGTVDVSAKSFTLTAKLGSPTYGICSNIFLDQEFKTVAYILKVTFHGQGEDSFSYEEDTQIQIKGQTSIFHHIDKNTVKRVK